MKNIVNNSHKKISGWGRANPVYSNIFIPNDINDIKNIIKNSKSKSLIPRGLGRSYGDVAQLKDKNIIELSNFKDIKIFNEKSTLKVGAGVSISEILEFIVPKGFFLPVTPGTKYITIGGAIASDVHGKNHHKDGSFANYIEEIKLIDGLGNKKVLTPSDQNKTFVEQFWATIGGMGLTGIIYEATFKLIKIESSFIRVDTSRFENLDSLMEALINANKKYRYSVAWLDSLHPQIRGVLTCGDHAIKTHYKHISTLLNYDPKPLISIPSFFYHGLLNKYTVRLFNELWFRKSPKSREKELQKISKFFYPLDGLKNWNRVYGAEGFVQYQFVVPDSASYLISKTLDILKDAQCFSFLTVLKRLGDSNQGLISFPMRGWTLSLDVPASNSNLYSTLDYLDNLIAKEGGRLYLAKDSRQSSDMFFKTYPNCFEWLRIKKEMDPRTIFASDLSERYKF